MKTAIPYITSYYKKDWGFCISHQKKEKLKDGNYEVIINSKFKKVLSIMENYLLKEEQKKEFFFQHIYVILKWQTMKYLEFQYLLF